MNAPNAEALLRVWEEYHGAHPVRRGLALLDAAWPEVGPQAWMRAPIGARDGCLLRLYELLFGMQLQTVAHCPHCGERLESAFSTRDVCDQPASLPAPHTPLLALREQNCEIDYRLPNSEDLLQLIESSDDPAEASAELLRRCIVAARRDGSPIDAAALPEAVVGRLAAEMERQDPNAEIHVALDCPACRHAWSAGFDIIVYLWSELDDWAQRLLADVHLLASAYGWHEPDILALSPARRQIYIDMVRA